MRDIKFRAWCLDYKVMDDHFFIQSNGIAHDTPSRTYDTPNIEIEENPNLIIMQFTGAFDSYSNEIYEDDICMVEVLGCCRVSICSFYGVIFHSKDNIEWGIMDCLSEDNGFKVIGNIHQNPEFLETK